jgi:hypothetical protein
MARPRSTNPGRHLSLYLKGDFLDTLKAISPNLQAALRMLIRNAAKPAKTRLRHNAEGEPASPATEPRPRTKTRVLCESCELDYGYPECERCKWNFS